MAIWKIFALLVPLILLLDLLWLGVLMKGFYADEIGELTRRSGSGVAPRWGAVILVYLVIPAGIVLFVRPLLDGQTMFWQAFAWGAVFGLVLYGVYDLTNLAVLEKWTLRVTVVDMMWGGVLCGTATLGMFLLERWQK